MLKELTKKRNSKGFTLIELIVVIAILGILMVITVPKLFGFKDKAAETADKTTAANIVKAAELYEIGEYGENVSVDKLLEEGLISTKPKPQVKGKKNFMLHYDDVNKEFYVTYNGEETNRIYPEHSKD